jgi:hypothetical protein
MHRPSTSDLNQITEIFSRKIVEDVVPEGQRLILLLDANSRYMNGDGRFGSAVRTENVAFAIPRTADGKSVVQIVEPSGDTVMSLAKIYGSPEMFREMTPYLPIRLVCEYINSRQAGVPAATAIASMEADIPQGDKTLAHELFFTTFAARSQLNGLVNQIEKNGENYAVLEEEARGVIETARTKINAALGTVLLGKRARIQVLSAQFYSKPIGYWCFSVSEEEEGGGDTKSYSILTTQKSTVAVPKQEEVVAEKTLAAIQMLAVYFSNAMGGVYGFFLANAELNAAYEKAKKAATENGITWTSGPTLFAGCSSSVSSSLSDE